MAVTGLEMFVLTVFIFEKYAGRHYAVPRNEEFIALLIDAEAAFWQKNVLEEAMPAPTGSETELDLLKSLPMADEVQLDDESGRILDEKAELDAEIKALQEKSDILKEKILIKMTENASGAEQAAKTTAKCGAWKITLTTQTAKRVDAAALKKAGIYDQYASESVSRVLRITKAKEA